MYSTLLLTFKQYDQSCSVADSSAVAKEVNRRTHLQSGLRIGPGFMKSENKRHESLEFRVTHRVYQSCDSLCTCVEAVRFSPHGKVKFHFSQKYGWESGEGLLQKHKGHSRNE